MLADRINSTLARPALRTLENCLPHAAVKVASRRIHSATASEHEARRPNARLPPCERAKIPPELCGFASFVPEDPAAISYQSFALVSYPVNSGSLRD